MPEGIIQRPDYGDVNNSPNKPNLVLAAEYAAPNYEAYDQFALEARNRREVSITQRMRVDLDHAEATGTANFEASQTAHQEAGTARANKADKLGFYDRRGLARPEGLEESLEVAVQLAIERAEMQSKKTEASIKDRNVLRRNLTSVMALVSANRGRSFVQHPVTPLDGDPGVGVQGLREKKAALRQKQRDIKRAPVGLADAKKKVRAQFADTKSDLPWVQIDQHGVNIAWPQLTVKATPAGGSHDYPQVPDLRGLMVMALEGPLLAHLDADLERQYANITTVARPQDKPKLIAAIDEEILELERVEVATILAARERGVDIEMVIADPRALLAVDGPAIRYRERTLDDE